MTLGCVHINDAEHELLCCIDKEMFKFNTRRLRTEFMTVLKECGVN